MGLRDPCLVLSMFFESGGLFSAALDEPLKGVRHG